MPKEVSLIVYPTGDLAASKRFFTELMGAEPYADSPQYVGYKSGEMEIGITPYADKDAGALAYWSVTDIRETIQALTAAGGTLVQDVTDVGYGLLVATVKDGNGAIVGLRQSPKQ